MTKKILLLEDDDILAETLQELLEVRGFGVVRVSSGLEALNITYEERFDLMILDVNVPHMDGFDFLSEMRSAGEGTPALFITARTDIASIAKGFEVGADDYIKKPFDFQELMIRIEALLRKLYNTRNNTVTLGDFRYDITKSELYRGEKVISLPPAKMRILDRLFKSRGDIVTKDELLNILGDGDEGSEGALRVHISRLRKLGLPIKTQKGIGYKLATT